MKLEEVTLTKVLNLFAAVAVSAVLCAPTVVDAQDNVFLKRSGSRSKKTGKVLSMTPESVVMQIGPKTEEVPSGSIRKIVFGREPNSLDRARERFDSGRFDDCLDELQKINVNPASEFVDQEIAYLQAFANAEIFLRGGDVTAQTAGEIKQFIENNEDSYRIFPATELLGKLFLAVNRADLAEAQFTKLSQSTWPEFKIKGLYHLGQTQLRTNKLAEAKNSFNAITAIDSNDPVVAEYSLLAECMLAKAEAMEGNTDASKQKLEAIIKREDPMVAQLVFAHAYNALGGWHEKQENWEEAAIAYLHTELLFAGHADPHAEALYRLSKVWTKLEESDRASTARNALRGRYKNSYWAKQEE